MGLVRSSPSQQRQRRHCDFGSSTPFPENTPRPVFILPVELAMPDCTQQETEIQASCTMDLVASKVQRISAAALSALERRLQEKRLPMEEQAFLTARLEAYRKAAALTSGSGCGRPDCCMA
ncbi:hypothetical protein [Azohydromonas australica]|uniref:hypothetical protein n=1 Tax=Azohydromonas australica TaxID=364039 RepID=UPI00146E8345|nr:hypothetical protein [Azohydromonas australica]